MQIYVYYVKNAILQEKNIKYKTNYNQVFENLEVGSYRIFIYGGGAPPTLASLGIPSSRKYNLKKGIEDFL